MSYLVVDSKRNTILDPAFVTYLSRTNILPQGKYYTALNNLFTNLRADGNLTKLDYLRIQSQDVRSNSLLNIVSSSFNATEIGSPVWTYGRGYTGSTNNYLHSNFTPSTNGSQYTKNSACMGAYMLTNLAESSNIMGCFDGTQYATLVPRFTDNSTINLFNGATTETFTLGTPSSQGLFSLVRTGATATSVWKDGVSVYTGTAVSTNLPTTPIYELCRNQNGSAISFSTNTLAASFCGSGTINQLTLYNSLQVYMREISIAV